MTPAHRATLFSTLLLAATPAAAQDALYGAQPPPGAAFIRFVNAAGAAVSVAPDFAPGQTLGVMPAQRVSPYVVVGKVATRVLALDARLSGRAVHAVLHVAPGGYLTVIVAAAPGGGPSVTPVTDAADFNQARARLVFYNATPACQGGGLLLEPKGVAVFTGVAAGAARSRNVNPVTAQLHAACAGQAGADVALADMQVDNSYSVWLMLPDGQPLAFVTRDTTLPYKP